MTRPRNLLLGFDAFGTLFKVKQPIEQQYGDIARRQFGLAGFSDAELRASFRAAFKAEARRHPNYGHASSMGAAAWWANVIRATFSPFLAGGGPPPPGLVPRLLERFATREAYTMAPQLAEQLRGLLAPNTQTKTRRYDQIVAGVITNSDDRVPGILASLGLRVSPLRFPGGGVVEAATAAPEEEEDDIHFHCMSYDVGAEKPDPRIFRAAQALLPAALSRKRLHPQCTGQDSSHDDSNDSHQTASSVDMDDWDCMYVGDEWDKDVVGAQAAGWFPVLLNEEGGEGEGKTEGKDEAALAAARPESQHLSDLSALPPQTVRELAAQFPAVRISSIASLLEWLQR